MKISAIAKSLVFNELRLFGFAAANVDVRRYGKSREGVKTFVCVDGFALKNPWCYRFSRTGKSLR